MTEVQHNMNALNAYNRLNANVAGLRKASEKLSSGYRINRAGDDAAGLAVSEKMRSQIKGLNQAVRNSQDGINMIQTYEGAAQETHSILQRMKELATESANGTYDNYTDRAAMQLEFDQLNDELNQIADTDFNGKLALNGGVMSDGLKATVLGDKNSILDTSKQSVDGAFEYSVKKSQQEAAIAELEAAIEAKKNDVPVDMSADAMDAITDLNDDAYTGAVASKVWANAGLGEAKSIDVQFEATKNADGTLTYTAKSGKVYMTDDADDEGVEMTADQLKTFTATSVTAAGATGEGGFKVSAGTGAADFANVVVNASGVEKTGLVNLHITGPAAAPRAPKDVVFADAYKDDAAGDMTSVKLEGGAQATSTIGTLTFGAKVTDAAMTEEIADVLKALDGVEITYENTSNNSTGAVSNFKATGMTATSNSTGKVTINGVDMHVTWNNGEVKISTLNGTNAGDEVLTIAAPSIVTDATTGGGKITVKLAIGETFYPDAGAAPDVNVIEADMTAYTPDTSALEAQLAALKGANAVSKSDAYDNSTARLTYSNHITLQTGARSKDAVDFTFDYSKYDKDMGSLKANLDLSSRADGLATANLHIDNQEDANYAIDQIDKAINKTSMVRATFGSIQNRLEHKITNLTTTAENLTEAESSIRDTDMASEMMNYTKFNILQQAAQSMLAQANQQPQSILQLLG